VSALSRKSVRWGESILERAFFLCAFLSVITTAVVIFILIRETLIFFESVSVTEFLFGTRWTPLLEPKSYGILPLVAGTALIVIGVAVAGTTYRSRLCSFLKRIRQCSNQINHQANP